MCAFVEPPPCSRRGPPVLKLPELIADVLSLASLPESQDAADAQRHKLARATVCSTWKEPALRLLYSAPYLTSLPTLHLFARALQLGESRWSDLCRIPYSTPGRYVRALDLRYALGGVGDGEEDLEVNLVVRGVVALCPALEELRLPGGEWKDEGEGVKLGWGAWEALGECKAMRVLEGVEAPGVGRMRALEAFLGALGKWGGLEVLSLRGPSDHSPLPPSTPLPTIPAHALNFPHLYTLHIHTPLPASHPLLALLSLASLPRLQTLGLPPSPPTLYALLLSHGAHLPSLTLHALLTSPLSPPTPPLPVDLLLLTPSLQSYTHHPRTPPPLPPHAPHLREVQLTRPRALSPSHDDAFAALGKRARFPRLERVRLKEFRWLAPGTSGQAVMAGLHGQVIRHAHALGARGVRLEDGEGNVHVP